MADDVMVDKRLFAERRRYFRYGLHEPLPLVVETRQRGEALGLGLATEVGTGGLCVTHLPLPRQADSGDELDLLLLGQETSLPLRGKLVRHQTETHFGVALDLSDEDCDRLEAFLIDTLL